MKSFNLSNSNHTAAGLPARTVTRRNHECESAQGELDAVQRRRQTATGRLIDHHVQLFKGNYEKIVGMLQERYGSNCVRLV
jgi:hypothetical protein